METDLNQILPVKVLRTNITATCLCLLEHFSEHTSLLATGYENGQVDLWNVESQLVRQTLAAPKPIAGIESLGMVLYLKSLAGCKGLIAHIRFSGCCVYSWVKDGSGVWKLNIDTYIPASGFQHTFCPAVYLEEKTTLVQPTDQGFSVLHSHHTLQGYKELCEVTLDVGSCSSLYALPAGKLLTQYTCDPGILLITGTEAGQILLYQILTESTYADGKRTIKLDQTEQHPSQPVLCLDYNECHNYGASASPDNVIKIWRLEDRTGENRNRISLRFKSHTSIETGSNGFNCITIRPDCKLLVACAWDGIIRLFSVKKGTGLAVLDFHRQSATSCLFTANLAFITSSKDKILCCWDVYVQKK